MARTSAGGRLDRLEHLKSLLKSGDLVTIGAAACELGVSARTLWRDVQLLREQGLPIEADRGRGGGVRLPRHWGVGRLTLGFQEAVDLSISLAVAERMDSPLFMANLAPIRRKLAASFAPDMKRRLEALKSRILVGPPVAGELLLNYGPSPRAAVAGLHRAFLMRQALDIAYRDEQGRRTRRVVEPHYLLLCSPIWYALAWDRLREAVRTFRCDRIESAEPIEEVFRLRPAADFHPALKEIGAETLK